ncbi:DUF4426 domain-containing protein [Pseudomonas sp. GV071]|jgi:hypothetical protein|uniref:DUF4426 domain-containing protein n=1 Tax=Pseudomonas sp. GV071 TaxID=2135754 RepID=UPI000D38B05F|nr:DUF4426 domain-containing protein [Pseudomonas sp. GV071]PTQ72894.1 uncharacterized protein DUF4426 [Pseudomonas sp. GV071]
MRRLALLILTLCLALPAMAERKASFGELDVHYNAFNSGFLQPDIAAAAGLTRSKTLGVLNVAVLKAGKASPATVTGTVTDLLGKARPLEFKQVTESGAIYYLAQFPFEQREVLRFKLVVKVGEGSENSIDFNQEFFPDDK